MIALLAPVKARLLPLTELSGWALLTATEDGDRRVVPRAAIGFSSARVSSAKTTAAQIEPSIAITLVVKRGAIAGAALESAFSAVIQSLHNWAPGEHGGRGWEPLRMAQITEPDFDGEEGLAGITLALTTQAFYHGQN